ncbi:uncharacterized protein LOC132554154 [Ylistrum balloti]|uniref:uncharacterized protein LOC132554154 n=1 Tax=Ylistrum balloti TaxID=509963 RepID=UPI002905A375|nr:uncharacterized protein LOC132554154 [Ylistrum balloti]
MTMIAQVITDKSVTRLPLKHKPPQVKQLSTLPAVDCSSVVKVVRTYLQWIAQVCSSLFGLTCSGLPQCVEALLFAEIESKLWTRYMISHPYEIIGNISLTSPVVSRGQCSMFCEMHEMCNMFEYDDVTKLCNVFHGIQPSIGNDPFPIGQRSVFKHIEGCAGTGYTLLGDGMLCFKVFWIRRTWADAFAACGNDGGRLLVLKNSEQLHYFLSNVKELAGKMYFWIGLTDRLLEGEWIFVDGTYLNQSMWPSLKFDNYCSGSDYDPYDADCAILKTKNRVIADCDCSRKRHYICERPLFAGDP